MKGKAQVVYGSRFTGERRNIFCHQWVGNKLLTLLNNVLYNTTLSDVETCYKLFTAQSQQGLLTIKSDRFNFEPGTTAKIFKKKGIHIYRVAHQLRWPRVRRGQEDNLARRGGGPVGSVQVPFHRLRGR